MYMSELHGQAGSVADNEQSLQELAWAIAMSEGQFSLILARCNYAALRPQMAERLREICSGSIREILLDQSVKQLYCPITEEIKNEQPPAVMVFGLESVSDIDRLLTSMNQVREEFRKHCPFPLVLWVNDEIVRKFIRLAPDFESWTTRTVFEPAPDQLLDVLRQKAEYLFSKVLDAGADHFLSNEAIFGLHYRLELDSALRDLHNYGVTLTPDLEACLQFIHGRDACARDEIDDALAYYQQSLAFWQQEADKRKSGTGKSEQKNPKSKIHLLRSDDSLNLKLREGALLFHIGLCHYRKAELHLSESRTHWQKTLPYFQQCLDLFEQEQRVDLVARFIGQLGEVLRRLEDWEKLHELAQKSEKIHETNGTTPQLAQDYGFLADVALFRKNWAEAKELAERALQTLEAATEEQLEHQGLYLLLLARAQQQLKQHSEAIANLERAREIGPQNYPQLYIQILEELRSLYFEQKQYLEAFRAKQERRSIEQQYGLSAFIGAGRLKPVRRARCTLEQVEPQATVAQEIAASGRQQDVKRLIERIGSTQHRLTVVYGQSGVGKSSVIEAGLVPALNQKAIGTRDVMPILLRIYTNWVNELGKSLGEALDSSNQPICQLSDLTTLLEQLRENENRNLLTVLIFDQFEEFFFVCKTQEERKCFFEFFRDCLNVPYLKVVLSLREDYLHLLLQCTRKVKLDAIDNNILDKDILYYVGNFSPEDAKSIILSLTERSQFYLEPTLVDELARELASEMGEVRPIELQVVGAQLQTENITTLAQYREHGPKEQLVQRYLEEVVADCGSENQRAAELVLYLLTDENNTRPLKTCAELERDLRALSVNLAEEVNKLDLVLRIFVESGLVFLLPEIQADLYQLVHDYLVTFIRRQQEPKLNKLIAELEQERERRERAEAEREHAQAKLLTQQLQAEQARTRRQKRLLIGAGVASVVLALLATTAIWQWRP